jgi:hypothetical protein
MKNTREITGVLKKVRRLPNSTNGNPRYLVSIRRNKPYGDEPRHFEVEAKTKVDSSFAYEVDNLFGKEVVAVIGYHFGSTHIESARESSRQRSAEKYVRDAYTF